MARALRHVWLAVLLWFGAASGAFAQDAQPLSAAEARAALFGYELSGYTEVSNIAWKECIDRQGATVYEFGDEPVRIGRLVVNDEGVACFAYAETQYSQWACWFVLRRGEDQIEFTPADGYGENFIVTARPRVRGCGRDVPVA